MNQLLTEVKKALKNERYCVYSFAQYHGFNPRTVEATLRRVTCRNSPPKGELGKEIVRKIHEVTGYDLLSKLGGGHG